MCLCQSRREPMLKKPPSGPVQNSRLGGRISDQQADAHGLPFHRPPKARRLNLSRHSREIRAIRSFVENTTCTCKLVCVEGIGLRAHFAARGPVPFLFQTFHVWLPSHRACGATPSLFNFQTFHVWLPSPTRLRREPVVI